MGVCHPYSMLFLASEGRDFVQTIAISALSVCTLYFLHGLNFEHKCVETNGLQ